MAKPLRTSMHGAANVTLLARPQHVPCQHWLLDATARRRWFGAMVLLAALAMLICGETVPAGELRSSVTGWSACFTPGHVVAFLDARALRRRTAGNSDLFEATLKEIQTEPKPVPVDREAHSRVSGRRSPAGGRSRKIRT